jgi:DNA mismatch repair protein MutH
MRIKLSNSTDDSRARGLVRNVGLVLSFLTLLLLGAVKYWGLGINYLAVGFLCCAAATGLLIITIRERWYKYTLLALLLVVIVTAVSVSLRFRKVTDSIMNQPSERESAGSRR